jgi:hypothetical protein
MEDSSGKASETISPRQPRKRQSAADNKHKTGGLSTEMDNSTFAALTIVFWSKCMELIEITVSKSSDGGKFIGAINGMFLS